MIDFMSELEWTRLQMPLMRRALVTLPDLTGVRMACSMHLDIKMVPLVEGLLERGAAVFLTTCNPLTVRDAVVERLVEQGAEADARHAMSPAELEASYARALAWGPTHLCEMGADLSVAARSHGTPGTVRAGMEATGTGVTRLSESPPVYPVFNWDDVPAKEGLHNRFMVGISTWQAFFEHTRLTLHGRRVLVVGYGPVGRGLAESARAYGGAVTVAERDPSRILEAQYAGYPTSDLDAALPNADVVVTATGRSRLIDSRRIGLLPDGAILLNASHVNDEIDVAALEAGAGSRLLPFVEQFQVDGRVRYLFAGGAMANLAAGNGDSLNAFQVPLAIMVGAIRHMVGEGASAPPGIHPLPPSAYESLLVFD